MDIRWLRTFVIAAENENFRQTAESLYMAQPTVTAQIKQLEKELGARLFRRSGRNIVLSEAGHRFLPHAKSVLSAYDEGVHQLLSWHQGYERKLAIAVSPILAAAVLPYIIRKFTERYPDIEVIIQVKESRDIGEMIARGEANMGLSRMKPVQHGVRVEQIQEEDVVCVCPHDGGDSESSPPVDAHHLFQQETLLIHNHPEYWDSLLAAIRVKHPRIRTMTVSQVHITKKMIEEGLGFSFLPKSALTRELAEGRLLEVDTPDMILPKAHTYMITREDTEENRIFRLFLKQYFS